MESPDNSHEPARNLRLGLAVAMGLSAAMWGLIYLGVASVWPLLANRPDIAVEGQGVPHLASSGRPPTGAIADRNLGESHTEETAGSTFGIAYL